MTIEKKIYTLYQLNRSIKNTLETKAGDIGFWVKESKNMQYKSSFNNVEYFLSGSWNYDDS